MAFTLTAGYQVARTAIVETGREWTPVAMAVWPNHPDMIRAAAMTGVGEAAARGADPGRPTLERVARLAKARPLATEPFLVHGAIEVAAGRHDRAERLLTTAVRRDPRSTAGRYLRADLYLRRGDILPGIEEMALLGRFLPGASDQLAPALAQYAATPGAMPKVKAVLAAYPEIRPALLNRLAANPDNREIIMALATPPRAGQPLEQWQRSMIDSLIERGQYRRAHATWQKFVGARSGGLLFNPAFAESNAPPPFNWQLTSSSGGVAEARDGQLQLLYYGRDDMVLARQLLMLPAGRFRLAMQGNGSVPDPRGLRWTVQCLPSRDVVMDLPVLGRGETAGEFSVPASGCEAQSLELFGQGQEFPQQSNVRLAQLQLTRASR